MNLDMLNVGYIFLLLLAKFCLQKGYHIVTHTIQKTFRIFLQKYCSIKERVELAEILQEY
jgi:hypothetical protein